MAALRTQQEARMELVQRTNATQKTSRTPYSLGEPMSYDQMLTQLSTDELALHILDLEQQLVGRDEAEIALKSELARIQERVATQDEMRESIKEAFGSDPRAYRALRELYDAHFYSGDQHGTAPDVMEMQQALTAAFAQLEAAADGQSQVPTQALPATTNAASEWTPSDTQRLNELLDYLLANQYMPVDMKQQLKTLSERAVRIIHQLAREV